MIGRILGVSMACVSMAAALSSTACGYGYYRRNDAWFSTTSGKMNTGGFVAGGGTIRSTTTVGGYPMSGVSIGPGGTTVYATPYGGGYGTPYPYGAPYGAPSSTPYGYAPYGTGYGYAPYGTYSSCTGAVACGSSVSVERSGVTVTVP